MAMGTRARELQADLFLAADALPRSAGHPFYQKLNGLLAEAGFDDWVEARCRQYYEQAEKRGRPSLPPGIYFRMLLVGYFEGLDSQRGIAWRCADSLSLREFLGLAISEDSPDHSTLTNTRKRLPPEVFDEVFQFVLAIAADKKLLSTKTVGIDSTTLEANAAMKSIVRRDTGEDWKEYVVRLMREEGLISPGETPSDDEFRRFDQKRKKKVSNEDWVSETDPDARITKMKDGRTHLAYKAEHVVDLDNELILSAQIYSADRGDTDTIEDSLLDANLRVDQLTPEKPIEEVAADKGYHSAETLAALDDFHHVRTYIPEPQRKHKRSWQDKPAAQRRAVYNNRRRTKGDKGRLLQRRRSERVERSFAHVCDSGGTRRSWLRGIIDVGKRYLIAAAAHNLSRILRRLFGIGKPKALQDQNGLADLLQLLTTRLFAALDAPNRDFRRWGPYPAATAHFPTAA